MRVESRHMYSFALFAALLIASVGGQEEPDGLEFVEKIFEDDPELDQLISGKPLKGVVTRGDSVVLAFSVAEREELGFPDVTLALEVDNPGGDADIYCLPWVFSEQTSLFPSPFTAVWSSEHSQGRDTVFLSRNQTAFDMSKTRNQTEDGPVLVADFICTVYGHSATPSDFRVTLDVDYESRALVEKEQDAMRGIYEACCPTNTTCEGWETASSDVLGSAKKGETVFDFCHMRDSFCNEKGRLIRLDMQRFGLECDFPASQIKKLKKLEKLLLNRNYISGDIDEIARALQVLPNLDQLSMKQNRLTGSLSTEDDLGDIGICGLVEGSLEHMNVDFNDIEGPIPPCMFGKDSNLHDVFLDMNPLNSPIPDVFSEDSVLEIFSVAQSNITGEFPQSLHLVPNLIQIDLKYNSIEGSLPEDIGQSPHLTTMTIQGNDMTGEIPLSLLNAPNLLVLSVRNNSFTKLPSKWSAEDAKKSKLQELNLAFNELEGTIPKAMVMPPNLTVITIRGNGFYGELPDYKNMFPSAYIVDFSMNEFTGEIPESWGDIGLFKGTARQLYRTPGVIDLSDNELSGPVPEFLLNGPVPFEISNRGFDVSGNMLDCLQDNTFSLLHISGLEDCDNGAPAPAPESDSEAPQPEPEEAPAPQPEAGASIDTAGQGPSAAPTEVVEDSNVLPSTETNAVDPQERTSRDLSPESLAGLLQEGDVSRVEGNKSTKSSGVSGAAIVFIVIALVVVLAAIIAAVFMVKKRRKVNAAGGGGGGGANEMELGAAGNGSAMQGVKFEAFHDDVDGARNVRMEGIGNT
ncbi:hypothetical protein BSKO_00933 [Bryopsis sp. KO-2023]|nr:hypothetical protein BSKO_00933 [Bryopsis sp. KO-2023]